MSGWVTGDVRDAPFVVGTDAIEVGPPDETGDTAALVFDKDHARLIAAAPGLLEALKSLVADIRDYERVNNLAPNPGRKDCWQSVTAAEEAIAKAEGAQRDMEASQRTT